MAEEQELEVIRSDLVKVLQFKKEIVNFLPYLKEKMGDDYLKKKIKNSSGGQFLEAINKGKTIGFLAWLEEIDKSAYIWLLVVSNNFRNQGVGSFLIDAALCEMKRIGYPKVWVKVKNDNYDVLSVFLKRNFFIKGIVNEENIYTVLLEKSLLV